MAFQLKIYTQQNPQTIDWNYQQLKQAVAARMDDYNNLAYTDDQMVEAKQDRAQLNKFKSALEDKRKEIRRNINKPYDKFAAQVKDITKLIDSAIANIDEQIKDFNAAELARKKEEIQRLFDSVDFPSFVAIDKIYNPKWDNKSFSLKMINDELIEQKKRIESDLNTINAIGEFKEQARIVYCDSLDLATAINEAKRLTDIYKKAEMQRAQNAARANQSHAESDQTDATNILSYDKEKAATEPQSEPERAVFTVLVTADKSQYRLLNDLFGNLKNNGVDVTVIKKEII